MRFLRGIGRIMLGAVLLIYVLLLLLAVFSDHIIFQPHPPAYDLRTLSLATHDPVQVYKIPTSTGSIAGAYLPNPTAKYLLLYSHGNGEDMGDDLPILEEYRKA